MKENIIFTDGSSRGNPGRGGWGAVLVFHGEVTELGGREEDTTNNRMEMMAVIKALEFALSTNYLLPATIYCDSSYVINGATKWIKGWQANGWLTKNKDEVLNKDLWEKIALLLPKVNVKFEQIEGHAGIVGNERCDEIATSFADGAQVSLYNGKLTEYSRDIFSLKKNETKSVAKKNNQKAFSYVSKVDGKIYIDKSWVECEKRVKGKSGVRFKKSFSKNDEESIVAEFSR